MLHLPCELRMTNGDISSAATNLRIGACRSVHGAVDQMWRPELIQWRDGCGQMELEMELEGSGQGFDS